MTGGQDSPIPGLLESSLIGRYIEGGSSKISSDSAKRGHGGHFLCGGHDSQPENPAKPEQGRNRSIVVSQRGIVGTRHIQMYNCRCVYIYIIEYII